MSEFDFMTGDGGFSSGTGSGGKKQTRYGGSWFFPLTLLGLALVGGLAILMCFLTRGVKDRPLWMMGLIFMVPAGAMFFSAMLLEFKTGVMTPSTSRRPQVIVAVVATLLTFLVGCIFDAIYLYGFIRNAGVNFVLAVDRGDTVGWAAYDAEGSPTRGEELNACAQRLLAKMPSYTDVGLITFEWEPGNVYPIQKANKAYKEAFPTMIQGGGAYGVSYYNAIDKALAMVEQANNKLPTRIIILTGGNEAVYLLDNNGDVHDEIANQQAYRDHTVAHAASRNALIERLKAAGCTVFVVSPKGEITDGLREIVTATGGLSVSIAEADTVPQFVSIISIDGDMLRANTLPAKVLTGIMLLLEGLVVGFSLSIMLSVSGQKRAQMIISPLMGILCFVMVKLLGTPENNPVNMWWLWEGLSFLPLGVIFMTGNDNISGPVTPINSNDWGMAGGMDPFSDQSGSSNSQDEWGDNSSSNDLWGVNSSGSNDINW